MPTAISTVITSGSAPLTLKLRPTTETTADYINDLRTLGFSVVKNVLPQSRADEYCDRAYTWLESMGTDFDRDDRATWNTENLPPHAKGGMYSVGSVAHEQFASYMYNAAYFQMWDIRAEPSLVKIFETIWGTDELLVSFDGINMAVPASKTDIDNGAAKPWPHVDQSPLKRDLQCIQGIINLLPNGEEDGGLMILVGSNALYSEFFDAHSEDMPEKGWPENDLWLHSEAQLKWFLDRGCYWKKVNADPGDVMVWDSRCVHFGARATGSQNRIAAYVCYKPAALISPTDKELKKKAFDEVLSTSHDPVHVHINERRPEHSGFRAKPLQTPVMTLRQRQLAGELAYV